MKLSPPGCLVLVAEISDLISDADLGVFLQIYLFYVLTQSILTVYSMLVSVFQTSEGFPFQRSGHSVMIRHTC